MCHFTNIFKRLFSRVPLKQADVAVTCGRGFYFYSLLLQNEITDSTTGGLLTFCMKTAKAIS